MGKIANLAGLAQVSADVRKLRQVRVLATPAWPLLATVPEFISNGGTNLGIGKIIIGTASSVNVGQRSLKTGPAAPSEWVLDIDIPQTERIDAAAVEALYQQHADGIHSFLRGVLKDADLAAEALQSTFAKAVERAHTARPDSIRGWLYRVALNEALAVRRRQKTHDRSLRWLGAGTREQESPEDTACRHETTATVRQALERLPEEQRQVVRMRIYDEMTFATIAETLNLPLGTVLTRMRLALKKLALYLPGETRNP